VRAVSRRTATGRSSGTEASGGVWCHANGGDGAAPVDEAEEKGRRKSRRPQIQSAQHRRQPPLAFLTAVLPPRLTAANGIFVAEVLAAARFPQTTTCIFLAVPDRLSEMAAVIRRAPDLEHGALTQKERVRESLFPVSVGCGTAGTAGGRPVEQPDTAGIARQ